MYYLFSLLHMLYIRMCKLNALSVTLTNLTASPYRRENVSTTTYVSSQKFWLSIWILLDMNLKRKLKPTERLLLQFNLRTIFLPKNFLQSIFFESKRLMNSSAIFQKPLVEPVIANCRSKQKIWRLNYKMGKNCKIVLFAEKKFFSTEKNIPWTFSVLTIFFLLGLCAGSTGLPKKRSFERHPLTEKVSSHCHPFR
jgi:hypothetical protein